MLICVNIFPVSFEKKTIKPDSPKSNLSLLKRFLRRIPRRPKTPMKPWQKGILGSVLALAIIFIIWLVWTIYAFFTHFSFGEIFLLFGSIDKDENNHTQILLLGSGDQNHDSPDLTDTILVMSLNHDKETVSLLSVPRDLWVEIPGHGGSRINRIFQDYQKEYGREGALEILKESIGRVINQEIHYYAKIDFRAFKQMVDALGGVDITIENKYCDQEYPDEELIGYDPFCIEAGDHHIDGDMALRLARSRHGVHLDENGNIIALSSDFDRARRQQQILMAAKNRFKESGALGSPTSMKELYDTYIDYVETDLGFREIWALAGFGLKLKNDNIIKAVLVENSEVRFGSFLYNPPRDLYGGASVLRPQRESFKEVQNFVTILFDEPEFFIEKPRLQILNGTGVPGLAQRVADKLIPYGFEIVEIGNVDDDVIRERTTFIFPNDEESFPATKSIIRSFIPGVIIYRGENYENTSFDITIELGKDSQNIF